MTLSVAVCVPYRARNPHDAALWTWCEARWRALFPDWRIIVGDSGHATFNRAASRNVAAIEAGDVDCYVYANSDTTFGNPSDLVTAVDNAVAGVWCQPAKYVEVGIGYTTTALNSDPAAPMADPWSDYERQFDQSPAGPQIVSRAAFDAVCGWDERFVWGWGREDFALQTALDVITQPHARCGVAIHLHHPRGKDDTFRARSYPTTKAHYMRTYGRALRERDPVARRAAMLAVVAGNRG